MVLIRTLALLFVLGFASNVLAQNQAVLGKEGLREFEETNRLIERTKIIIEKTKSASKSQAEELEGLTKRVGKLITSIGSTNQDTIKLRSQLGATKDLLKLEQKSNSKLQKQLKDLNSKLQRQSKRAAGELSRLKTKNRSANNQNVRLEKELRILKENLKNQNKIGQKQKNELRKLRTEHEKALRRLNQGLEKITKKVEENKQLRKKLDGAQKLISTLNKQSFK